MRGTVLVALLACSGLVHADAQRPVSIGAYLSLSGAAGAFGSSTKEGIELAVDQFNAQHPAMQIKLEVIDTEGKPNEATVAVMRLADRGVVAVIGEVSSSVTLPGATVAQRRGLPLITPAATSAKVTAVGDLVFRACQTDDAQGKVMARFATSLRIKRVAILKDSQPYSTDLAGAFTAAFEAQGGTIAVDESYASGATDFEPQLRAIAAAKVGWVFVPGYYPEVARLAQQAAKLGIGVRFLGGDGWDSDELGKLAGNALDGSYFVNHFAVDDKRTVARRFVGAFQTRYRHAPDGLAALGYDAANVVLGALAKAKSTTGADLAAAIRATTLSGVTGDLAFHPKDQGITKTMVVLKIVGGKPRYAETLAP